MMLVNGIQRPAMHAHPYDDLVMDHIKHARNYRVPDDANRMGTGSNPLCGDEIVVYLRIDGERIADAAFQCTCCGISMASASIMTEMAKGRTAHDAKVLLRRFVAMVDSRTPASDRMSDEWLALLETVRRFPARTRCAALPWVTLEGILENREHAVEPY